MQNPPEIHITANGKPSTTTEGTPLPEFINQLGLNPAHVVVERNGSALTPSEARKTALADGDRLEIVRIVAGG